MTIYPKCENNTFEVKTAEDKTYCFVQCKECKTAIGVLENVDFIENFNLVVNNKVGLDRLINERVNEIKTEINELNNKIIYILEVAEKLNRNL